MAETNPPSGDRLSETEKWAVIGQLAGGTAHDITNSISAILIHLGLLRQDAGLSETQEDALKLLEQETNRVATLTRQLMAFGRRRVIGKMETVDLNALLADILKMLRRLMRENIKLTFEPCDTELKIAADVGLLEQLVMRIGLLARDALPHGGVVALRTDLQEMEKKPDSHGKENQSGRFAMLTADWQAANEADFGIITGLEAVREIAGQHQGWVRETRSEGSRRSISVFLPVAEKPEAERIPGGSLEGSETILLVEDEDYLRRVTTLNLRKLGYAVLDVPDAQEAMKTWRKHQSRIDLLFTDWLLPDAQSGVDLARRMRREKPSLKIMVSSGHLTHLDDDLAIDGRKILHVAKPYSGADLARLIRRYLDSTE